MQKYNSRESTKMAKINTRRAFFDINFSEGRSPLFSIPILWSALSMSNLVTQGSGSIEMTLKMGYYLFPLSLTSLL